MKRTVHIGVLVVVASLATFTPVSATEVDGRIKLGGVIVDEDAGDLSVMQETYNIYEGFSLTQLWFNGSFNPKSFFTLDLTDINLDNRKAAFDFHVPGQFKFFTRYDQHRQVFDPQRAVNSSRKDWRFGAWLTPRRWVQISADYGYQTRNGNRLGYPAGTESQLGNSYDFALHTGSVEAEFRKNLRALAVTYSFSDYSDNLTEVPARSGYVVAARFRSPCYFSDKVTHTLRGAVGKRNLSNWATDYTLSNFQYVGIAGPFYRLQLRYNLYLSRIDDSSTQMKTDNVRNVFDLTYFYRYGRVYGGYGYEINDDDRSLTSYNTYNIGGSFRNIYGLSGKIEYADRAKKDEEKLTLLKDIDTALFLAKLQWAWRQELVLGAIYKDRQRDFPDIGTEATGEYVNTYGRYGRDDLGTIGAEYTYSEDLYRNLAGRFNTKSHAVTARLWTRSFSGLVLGASLTYLDVRGDLDIEKSIPSFEARYRVLEDYSVELKYNIYNYDDYILWDRYYTANIVWINVAYDFDYGRDQ
jgi:hypothetical protein